MIKKQEIESSLKDLQNLLKLWLNFKKFFKKSLTNEPITREDEQAFLEIKSAVAKCHRTLAHRFKDEDLFYYGADQMTDLLRQSISVSHVRALPAPDRQSLYKTWHFVYIYLARMVGALRLMAEGYAPKKHVKESTSSVSSIKAGGKGPRGKAGVVTKSSKFDAESMKGYIKIALIIAAVAVAVFILKSRLS